MILAQAYGSKPGDLKWNPNADINNVIELIDLVTLALHWHSPTYMLTVIVDPVTGGFLDPGRGTHEYEAGTVVSVYWWHNRDYGMEGYEINGTMSELPDRPYNITMDANYVLRAVYFFVPPLRVSLRSLSASLSQGDVVSFNATSYGGKGLKTYLWYLNDTRVATYQHDADLDSWSFAPSAPGTYYVVVSVASMWNIMDIVTSATATVIVSGQHLNRLVSSRFKNQA